MHAAHGGQLGAFLGIEVVQIGLVLEGVGVQILAVQSHVGLHIVGIFDDLQIDAFSLEHVFGSIQDLGVRRGRGAHLHGGGGLGMANQSTGGQHGGQRQQKFFHGKNLGERVIEKADQDPRLSLRRVAQLPKLWKICTMMMSRITVAIMMSVW